MGMQIYNPYIFWPTVGASMPLNLVRLHTCQGKKIVFENFHMYLSIRKYKENPQQIVNIKKLL